MRLADDTDVTAEAPLMLGPLIDTDDVLVQGGVRHSDGAAHAYCPDACHMAECHAELIHLPYCTMCFPLGRAA